MITLNVPVDIVLAIVEQHLTNTKRSTTIAIV